MSAQQTALTTAAANLETALTALAAAYVSYQTNTSIAVAAAAAGDRHPINTVSGKRLDSLIAARMRGLGLGGVFEHARSPLIVPATWATDLASRVTGLVP